MDDQVDIRLLKSGKTRLRFKLNEEGYDLARHAFSKTNYKYDNTALTFICENYLMAEPCTWALNGDAQGSYRLLVNVFPDEYEVIEHTLDIVREKFDSDANSLAFMCLLFLDKLDQEGWF